MHPNYGLNAIRLRYMHVSDPMRDKLAEQLGGLLWTVDNDDDDGPASALAPA